MPMQLLDKAVFIKEVSCRFPSVGILQSMILYHVVEPLHHAIEANL
jgi:hypothetical protein